MERQDRLPVGWSTHVVPTLAPLVTEALLTHMRARDDAPDEDGPGTFIHFLVTHNLSNPAALAIEQGIAHGEFSLADVAARFIIRRRIMGVDARWELGDFNQESFNKLAPLGPHSLYDLPVAQVDEYDTSWTSRRAYVAGRVKQPPDRDHIDAVTSAGDVDQAVVDG